MFSEVALLYMFSSWQHGNIFRELKYVLCCFQVLLIISVMPSQDFYPFHWPQLYFKVINATSYNKEPTCSILVLMTLVPRVISLCFRLSIYKFYFLRHFIFSSLNSSYILNPSGNSVTALGNFWHGHWHIFKDWNDTNFQNHRQKEEWLLLLKDINISNVQMVLFPVREQHFTISCEGTAFYTFLHSPSVTKHDGRKTGEALHFLSYTKVINQTE